MIFGSNYCRMFFFWHPFYFRIFRDWKKKKNVLQYCQVASNVQSCSQSNVCCCWNLDMSIFGMFENWCSSKIDVVLRFDLCKSWNNNLPTIFLSSLWHEPERTFKPGYRIFSIFSHKNLLFFSLSKYLFISIFATHFHKYKIIISFVPW